MANYNTSANIILTVNGKQAQKMLISLEKDAQRLEKNILKAATAGDKASMRKLQRELNTTKKTMDQLRGTAFNVDNVLRRLDKASPRELNKTLKLLQQQLNGIERGSAAWTAHTAKIKAVKAELAKVNATLVTQQTMWTRMNNWLNTCQTAIMGMAAAIAGLVMAGRKAVNAFAGMEEELANTRKYTRMSEQDVLKLNEAFEKMDTRTPREKLNELAQEAGRLGKNTIESVQGYVEAADIINVALVDLGEGATQTIAKITNIFGVEEMLGTKDAMLAVGSTVNVLSQNCTASKPYLVEFAQRMAGIGSQAGMTIPQILAFGAVLDANGQKVEMSATAIQKVIMKLANKNKEFAATLGLDAEKLNQTLKHSAKDGLLMFLEALQNMGRSVGFENATMTLAPAFKEMGLDAARVSQVLSTLAMHIDEVKWQLGNAEQAFNEASSATNEFNIFNNTAQASIDKAKNRVHELAVQLGEKLFPVMRHIYTSSGIFLRVLNTMVDFFIKYRREIITLVVTIASYNAIMLVYNTRTVLATRATALFHGALRVLRTLLPALKLLFTPLINAIQYFTNGLQVNYAMQERWRKSMQAMKFSNWVGLILAVAGAVYMLASRWKESQKAAEEARKEQEEYKKSLTDIDEASSQHCANEVARLELLYNAAIDESKSKDERRKAAEKLQKLYPDYFKNLSAEEIMVGRAKSAYDKLRDSIIEVARARAAAAKIEENEKELLTLEQQEEALKKKRDEAKQTYDSAVDAWESARQEESIRSRGYGNSTDAAASNIVNVGPYARRVTETGKAYRASEAAYNQNVNKQAMLNNANKYLSEKYKISSDAIAQNNNPEITPGSGAGGAGDTPKGGGSSAHTDKFAKEKQWRDQQEALARISYAKGETDYVTHTARMSQILVEFYERELLHTDLGETERLQIMAQWEEAKKKQRDEETASTLEDENSRHNKEIAELKQFYIDGKISKETYDLKTEEAEIKHQRNLAYLTKEGSKERLQAESQLQSLLIAQMQRKQQEAEKLEKKYQDMKKDYFGDTPQERQAKLDADLELLKVVYDREIQAAGDNAEEKLRIDEAYEKAKLALKKKYGLLSEEDTRNAMERGVAKTVEWLNSDGGKAITGSLETLTSGMSAVFSQLSTLMQAELDIQTAAIEKRYEKEIEMVEGNTYKTKRLEEQKEKDIAKAKNEANRKMYAMQVIQAVAQTAQNALSAYGSAAAIPLVGYILAPIAAAMAVAAGAVQVAAIKKQQQASEAQGYSEGGFTRPGRVDEPAGIVHAGEWVASQRLVNNPTTRPMLEALDYAQRNNTIGSLRMSDVSRSITAPMRLASQGSPQVVVTQSPAPTVVVEQNSDYADTMRQLVDRLNEPFVTVNTVTGDTGIKQAQDEYTTLMRNKTPKSRRQ